MYVAMYVESYVLASIDDPTICWIAPLTLSSQWWGSMWRGALRYLHLLVHAGYHGMPTEIDGLLYQLER
jgi:hypothetical protein